MGTVADVAELADAQASGACGLRLVEVRLLSSALKLPYRSKSAFLASYLQSIQLFNGNCAERPINNKINEQ